MGATKIIFLSLLTGLSACTESREAHEEEGVKAYKNDSKIEEPTTNYFNKLGYIRRF